VKEAATMRVTEEGMRTPAVTAALLLAATVGLPQSRSFTGEIMDSQCAAMGTHAKMMQGVEARNAKECTQKCVQLGGKYALFDAATKRAYQLDGQEKAAAYAGQKVAVKGTYDAPSKTIHVESIEAR
jgi:hypothetical protein